MKNKPQKIAIFGGSFDPPHYGHYDIVKNLERAFDKVIVVPAYVSPFKTDGSDAAVRFALCKKIFASEKTEVSRREVSKSGVSYSIDTAKYFSKKYADASLYWVIGSEETPYLDKWRNIDELKKLVKFYIVPRPGFAISDEIKSRLKKNKIKTVIGKFCGLDISSTRIKIDIAFGKPNSFMPSAAASAVARGVFDTYGKYVALLYKYGLSERRIEHTYAVALRGAELAKLYGASARDAVTACILHDMAKSLDWRDYENKIDFGDFPEPTRHGLIAAHIAKAECGISDEIAHAIRYHTTGTENMTVLDEIVYLADKTAAGRRYESLPNVRYLCEYDKTLAMYYALSEVSKLKDSEACVHSVCALDYYKKLAAGKALPTMPERTFKAPSVAETPETPVKTVKPKKTDGLKEARNVAITAAKELDLHKGRDIDVIELGGKTIVADYFVIASASSSTAVRALGGYVEDKLTKKFGIDPSRRDLNAEWYALDYGAVIIHIFTDKTREFYNIERLWADGTNVTRIGDK